MKKIFFFAILVSLAFFKANGQTATLTQKGDSLCWSFDAPTNVDCVTMEVSNPKTKKVFKTTFCVQPGANFNCMLSNVTGTFSGCCNPGGLKGDFRLAIRQTDAAGNVTYFYSNTVNL